MFHRFACAAALALLASPEARAQVPSGTSLRVESSGIACPNGTVTASIVGDGILLRYSAAFVRIAIDDPTTIKSAACTVVVHVDRPAGWRYELAYLLHQGTWRLSGGMEATLATRVRHDNAAWNINDTRRYEGPLDGSLNARMSSTARIASTCGATSRLTLSLDLRLRRLRSDSLGVLRLAGSDSGTRLPLEWRRCS